MPAPRRSDLMVTTMLGEKIASEFKLDFGLRRGE